MSGWPERPMQEGWTPDRVQSLAFRQLDRADFDTLMDWTDCEGWNPGLHDREAFWAQDPDGFRGFHVDGELIAGGSIVNDDGGFGFMGFFIVRPDRRIGPLFADDTVAADALYRACLDAAPGEDIHLDVPMNNPAAVALMERHGAEPQFECARMVHGPAPDWPMSRIDGVTSYELG